MEEKIATDNEAVPEKPPQQVFCEKCGALITQDTEICPNCGCPTKPDRQATAIDNSQSAATNTINKIKSVAAKAIDKMKSVGIKRIATIAVSVVAVIAVMNYSKTLLKNPKGIVAKFEPITGPIITLVYNLVIGGIIGVAGSIYYFFAIRNYVMEHKPFFASLDAESI